MPRANPDYAGITQVAKSIAAQEAHDLDAADAHAADTLSGRTDIVWSSSRTEAITRHTADSIAAPPTVTHAATFRVEPKALPPVRLEYGVREFWPLRVEIRWVDGVLAGIYLTGQQATKAGLGQDERSRNFRPRAFGGFGETLLDPAKIPAVLRAVIARYEVKVPVASPSPVVIP